MAINLKATPPDSSVPIEGFLFGADSQAVGAPSVYPLASVTALFNQQTGIVSIKDFGAKGDGETDDTLAFEDAGAYLRSVGGGVLSLPPELYICNNPFALIGVPVLSIIGYGARIQNNVTSDWDFEKQGLWSNSQIFDGMTPPEYNSGDSGILIATAEIGDTEVVCLAPEDANNFEPGDNIAIVSHLIQVSGKPYNFGYFDFVKVVSVNSTTGVVEIDRPLNNKHRSDAIEEEGFEGAARIYIGNKAANIVQTDFFSIRGVEFVSGAAEKPALAAYGARQILIEDCHCPYLWIGDADSAVVRNCTGERLEPDKQLGSLLVENCRFREITQASGTTFCKVVGGQYERVNLSPRHLYLEGVTYSGDPQSDNIISFAEHFNLQTVDIRGCEFRVATPADSPGTEKVVFSTIGSTAIDGEDFTLYADRIEIDDSVSLENVRAFMRGSLVQVSYSDGARYFRVKDVYAADGVYVLEGDFYGFPGTPTGLRKVVERVSIKNCSYVNCSPNARYQAYTSDIEDSVKSDSVCVTYKTGVQRVGASATLEGADHIIVPYSPTRIEVNVITPYTGASAGAYVNVRGKWVNLKVPGLRIFDRGYAVAIDADDSDDALGVDESDLTVLTRTYSSKGEGPDWLTDATDDKRAVFTVRVFFPPRTIIATA